MAHAGPLPRRQPPYTSNSASDASVTPPGTLRRGRTDEERRARRQNLRTFYGISGSDQSVAASKTQQPISGDDLGSAGGDTAVKPFNAPEYYNSLISRSSLDELMKRATSLSGEMAQLESSRHSLVYNHHHQLFSACDTIQVLNTRTPQLIAIVTSLQDSFSSISQLADSITVPDKLPSPAVDAPTSVMRRLRLMIDAEEPSDKIRSWWETVKPPLDAAAGGGDAAATKALEGGLGLIDGLP